MDISSIGNSAGLEVNHDSIGMLEDGNCGCFAVCDGSPSSSNGDKVAETVIDSILDDFKNTQAVTRETIVDYFKKADEKLWAMTEATRKTTLPEEFLASAVVVLTDENCVICGHLGNCRMYYLSENYLQYITPDHSLAYQAHAKGEFRFGGIRKNRDRRKLTAYIGADPMCKAEIISPIAVRKKDAILICSDGFWENISERKVERTLKRSKSASEWLRKMIKVVRKNNPKDNYSAITIIF